MGVIGTSLVRSSNYIYLIGKRWPAKVIPTFLKTEKIGRMPDA